MAQGQEGAKPVSATLRLGGLFDTRVGSGSGGGLAENKDDEGFAVTAAAGWQALKRDNLGLRFDYNGYANFHNEHSEYDVIDQTVSVEPQYFHEQITYSMPFAYNYVLEDQKTDMVRYSAAPTVTFFIPRLNHAISVYGVATKIDDRDHAIEDEDGRSIGGGCAYLLFFKNKSVIRLLVDYQHARYDETVGKYDGEDPADTDRREDAVLQAGLDIQYQLMQYVALYANYTYIHTYSNVDLYDYDRNLIEAGIAFKY